MRRYYNKKRNNIKVCLIISGCIVLLVFLIIFKNKNTIKCSVTSIEYDQEVKIDLTASFDRDDKLINLNVIYDIGNKNTTNEWCKMLQIFDNNDKDTYIKCYDTKIEIKGYNKLFDLNEEMTGKNKEEFIQKMKKEDYICK